MSTTTQPRGDTNHTTGMSWIIEALLNTGKLSEYKEKEHFMPMPRVSTIILHDLDLDDKTWPTNTADQLTKLMQMLQANKPFIAGHNLVYDLCFLHAAFLGDLPSGVDQFQAALQALFPRLLDTKMLISPEADENVIDPPLGDVFRELAYQSYPFVAAGLGWGYGGSRNGREHNAGFDSYVCSEISPSP